MGDENGEKKKGVDGWKTKAIWATGGAVGITIAAPFVVGAIGFGATGITAGSWATTIMASYGGAVTKGSVCAILQSVGATGTLGTTGTIGSALLGTGVGGVAGVAGEKLLSMFSKEKPEKSKL
ncbi:hypothetical protein KUTeg_016410 [Tegillarca granosa]|uniref:Uncharacterized protein n=1 Tax=Tegillarca granosa TaxID=220873 RepID=A0ABQ9ER27_TEGGR|nr:hypothetical protein KUTeg_016410 [Tegillarca granosa]